MGIGIGGTASRLVLAVLIVAGSVHAKDKRLKEAARPGEVKPGKEALLKSPKGMHYFLRVPKKYDAKKGARLVVFLHGSNMNGLSYLRSFQAKRWASDAILCCPNGETGNAPYGANNFTFSSAPFVAEITELVQKDFKTTVTYVGGHSQGGYLTFSVIMHFPKLYHGAIPMASDCWMQNEPNLWEDQPDVLADQKRIAIAVIHGRADPVVKFKQGEHSYDVFRAMGYPKLRLFAPQRLGHQFMLSPVDDALEWLDAMNGREEKASFKLAEKWAKGGELGWALRAAQALAAAPTATKATQVRADKLVARCEAAAKKALPAMQQQLEAGKPEEWIPEWLEFWRVFGGTQAAQPLVRQYEEKRVEQRQLGTQLFNELRRQSEKAERQKLLRQILEQAPHTYEGYYAWKWLQDG